MNNTGKETRFISGKSIEDMRGYDSWIVCTTNEGIKFSISFKLLFELFDNYEFLSQRHGDRFRAKKLFSTEELS